jgi:AcrR family transcriptional regulator
MKNDSVFSGIALCEPLGRRLERTVSKVMPRGQYARSEDTRRRILDAALAEAGESGFQNTSVATIAARADVAVGVLNYHFGSKKDLLAQLMASQVQDFVSRLAAPEQDENFFVYEEKLLLAYLKFLEEHPSYVRLGEEIRLHDAELYREGIKGHVRHIRLRLQRGIERGDLRPMSRDELRANAFFVLGTLTFLDRFLESDDYPGHASVARSFIAAIRGGFAADPARPND